MLCTLFRVYSEALLLPVLISALFHGFRLRQTVFNK